MNAAQQKIALIEQLQERGLDRQGAAQLVKSFERERIESALRLWDSKSEVGPGLLTKLIRDGDGLPEPQRSRMEVWIERVEIELPDLIERWPYGRFILASRALSIEGGGWEVDLDALRRWALEGPWSEAFA
jgi:hypothetical protein